MISNPHPIAFQLSFYCLAQAVLRPSTTHGNAFHIGIQGISITLTWHSHHRHPRKNASLPVILMRLTNFKRRIKDVKRYFRIFAAKT